MKTRILLPALLLVAITLCKAQPIPNSGFEIWNDSIAPVGWTSFANIDPSLSYMAQPDFNDKREGSASVKLTTGVYNGDTIPGYVALGGSSFSHSTWLDFDGVPYLHEPDSLFLSYKYEPVGDDTAWCQVEVRDSAGHEAIGAWFLMFPTNGAWVNWAFRLPYVAFHAPGVRLFLNFQSSWGGSDPGHPGSTLHVDGVSFSEEPCYFAEVGGTVYFDLNSNGIRDTGEPPVRNKWMDFNNQHWALTDQNGYYHTLATPGAYTVTPHLNAVSLPGVAVPASRLVHADTACQYYGGNNFVVQPTVGYCDGQFYLINVSRPNPGFENEVEFNLWNYFSANPISPVITLNYDSPLVYTHATSSPSPTVDSVNRRLTWNLNNIGSGDFWYGEVFFYTPASTPLGYLVNYSASISGTGCAGFDSLVSDLQDVMVGSHDPNDKSVSPVGVGAGGDIPSSTPELKYIVRFQNTGTAAASYVRVIDTISQYLDISTLKVLGASHDYRVLIKGREITFEFLNIHLPDSNTNEAGSHGYIQYSIKPTNSFVQGTVITNRADIYFDFNEPVRTNTTVSTANNFLSVTEVKGGGVLAVYPNPATTLLYIASNGVVVETLRVYNVTGQLLTEVKQPGTSPVDISGLNAGVYLAEIITSEGKFKTRWVKM